VAAVTCIKPMMGWIVRSLLRLYAVVRNTDSPESQVDIKRRIVRLLKTKNTQPRTVPLTRRLSKCSARRLRIPFDWRYGLIFSGAPGRDGVRRPYQFDRCGRQSSANKV